MVIKRIIFDILLFLSVFIFPWYITIIISFIGIFAFKNFYEFIVSLSMMYSIYLIFGNKITPFVFSLIISIVYMGIQVLRRYIILYKNEISY